MSQELIELDLEFLHQTDDALLIQEGKRTIWIPKSVCKDVPLAIDSVDKHSNITIRVQHWFAQKEGLI